MKNSNSARSGSGTSSIMVIIVVVCLTVFGVLALVMVRSEGMLTEKSSAITLERYEADTVAQRTIAQIDAILYDSGSMEDLRNQLSAVNGAVLDETTSTIRFEVQINESNVLEVVLGELQPGSAQQRYKLVSYRQKNITEWNPETDQNVWDGN